MTDIFIAFLGGVAAHQTDRFIRDFQEPWRQFCRYVVGVLTIFVFFTAALRHFNRAALRDAMLAFLLSVVGVGAGVVSAHFFDVLRVE
jgi:hypothetical protein